MEPTLTSEPAIILCGPTASGKTAVALALAEKIDAEIISADSGQIYRGLDIGTAKPTASEREKIKFHLIDILNPDQKFSAAEFRTQALEAIGGIRKRGKRVLIAGGTGLYLRALEKGLFEGPASDPEIRAELTARIEREGVESLHCELEAVDPAAAKIIPSRNRQRIIRALEVERLTGRPISEWWRQHRESQDETKTGTSFLKFGLDVPREELNRSIEERVDRMISQGLVEETKRVMQVWGGEAPALKMIGYKEIVGFLEGKSSLATAVSLIKQHTRQYAKRQRTWFRRDQEIRWVRGMTEIILGLDKVGLAVTVRPLF